MRRMRSSGGFTLIELIVVMAIAAAVVAIVVPVARTLANGNRAMGCSSKMQRISQALKLYVLDEGAAPPFYPANPSAAGGNMIGRGLYSLVDAGYLGGYESLHCPSDREHVLGDDPAPDPDDPFPPAPYATSYFSEDSDVACQSGSVYELYNTYKYLCCRGVTSADPDYKRQLWPYVETFTGSGVYVPRALRAWHPDDTTVVMWCNYHYLTIREARQGQYNALFWDGSARRMPGSLLRDGTPVDAWRVKPSDDPTP